MSDRTTGSAHARGAVGILLRSACSKQQKALQGQAEQARVQWECAGAANRSKEAEDSVVGAEEPRQVKTVQRLRRVPAKEVGWARELCMEGEQTMLCCTASGYPQPVDPVCMS